MLEVEFEYERPRVRGKGSRALQAEIDAAIIHFLEDVADFAVDSFHRHVPIGDTTRLYEAVNKGRVEKSPGGFSISVGIAPITELEGGEDPEYPKYVDTGSGLFGPRHKEIVPEHGNVMAFTVSSSEWVIPNRKSGQDLFNHGPGETVITRFVEGQHPQYFSQKVDEETKAYFKPKKRELGRILSKMIADSN